MEDDADVFDSVVDDADAAPAAAEPAVEDDWEPYQPPQEVAAAAPVVAAAAAPIAKSAAAEDDWEPYKPPAAAEDDWEPYKPPVEPESQLGTFIRKAAHGAPPAVAAGMAGAATGGALGAAGFNPITTFGGALIGGFAGGYAGSVATEKGAELLGIDDAAQLAANAKAHPWTSAAGEGVSNLAGFGFGAVRGAVRAASSGISALGETGSQIYQRGREFFTPEGFKEAAPSIIAQGAAGAAAPRPRAVVNWAEQQGGRLGERIRPPPPTPTPTPEPPPPTPPTGPPQADLPAVASPAMPPVEAPLHPGQPVPDVIRPDTQPSIRPDTQPSIRPDTQPSIRPDTQPSELVTPPPAAPPHGSPGPKAAPGVAESQIRPPRDPNHGPEDYGKDTPARDAGGGMNVGAIDPTLAHAITPEKPIAAAAPAEATAPKPTVGDQLKARQAAKSAGEQATAEINKRGAVADKAMANFERALQQPPQAVPTVSPAQMLASGVDQRGRPLSDAGKRVLEAKIRKDEKLDVARRGMAVEPATPAGTALVAPAAPPASRKQQILAAAKKTGVLAERSQLKAPKQLGDFQIVRGSVGQHVLMKGAQVVSQHPNLGQALTAMHQAAKEAGIPVTEARRVVGERGRSGRPIKTEPLPIGSEQAILEKGYEKATGPKLPSEQAPPERQALERKRSPEVASVLARSAEPATWKDKIPTNMAEAKELGHRIYEGAVDSSHPYARMKAFAERELGRPLNKEEDFHRLARTVKGLGGKLESVYRAGPFDPETRKVIGPALNPILKKVSADPDEFKAYAIARRAIEIESQGKKSGVPLADANKVVAELGSKWGPVFKELGEFQTGVLKMGRHLYGDEAIAKMTAANQSYVPFYRAIDPKTELGDMFRTGGGLTVKDPLERLKGSERQIINPLDSVLRNTAMITDLAEKNAVHLAMKKANDLLPPDKQFMTPTKSGAPLTVSAEQRQRMLDAGIPADMIEKMRFVDAKAFSPDTKKMRLFENGKEQLYDVPEDISRVIAGMDRPAMGMLMKIASAPASWLRAGATLTPEFGIKNVGRDQFTAFIQSKGYKSYIPFYDAVQGLKGLFDPKTAAQYNEWLRNGGANANLVSFDKKMLDIEPRSFAGKLANVVTHPTHLVQLLRDFSETLENATRFGGYLREGKAGIAAEQRAFNQRELTIDFQRSGSHPAMRALNMLIPFFNAQVQGLDRLGRAFRDDPATTMIKTLGSITLPSMLLWMHNKDDPRYQELPQWQKMLFWIFITDDWKDITSPKDLALADKLGDQWVRTLPNGTRQYNAGKIWRFPKPFAEGQIFGSLPERIGEAFGQQKPNAFKHVGSSIVDALAPSVVPQIALPALEQMANRSFFLQRPLMSEQQAKGPQAQQQRISTSETAKVLAGAIRSVAGKEPIGGLGSPIVVDNYIRQWTGGLGNHVVKLIDEAMKTGSSKAPVAEPTKSWADVPGVKAFAVRFPDQNPQSVQDFYEARQERSRDKVGTDALKKTDPKAYIERVRQGGLDPGKIFADQLKAQRSAIEKIAADKTMSPEDKRNSIDLTMLTMIGTARKGLAFFEKTKRKELVH